MFAQGVHPTVVARLLEVSSKSGYQWHRTWEAGGPEALASKGPPGPDRLLSDTAQNKLAARLDKGAIAAGYPDERWTLARVATQIGRLFHRRVSLQTASVVLHRMGWSAQVPAHRARERDEAAITHWRRYRWPAAKGSRAGWARTSVSPTSPASR
jgi:putative transposase